MAKICLRKMLILFDALKQLQSGKEQDFSCGRQHYPIYIMPIQSREINCCFYMCLSDFIPQINYIHVPIRMYTDQIYTGVWAGDM